MNKVTFFVHDIYKAGGVQRVNTIIVNELAKGNKKIRIISLFKSSEQPFFELDPKIVVENLFEKPVSIKKNFLRIASKIKKIKFDTSETLIISGMTYVPLFFLIFWNKKIKKIAWEHQNYFFGKIFGLNWFGRRLAKLFFDSIVVLSKTDYNQYNANKNLFSKARIEQIYNPIDPKIKSSSISKRNKIITCGSLSHQKGIDLLIECASKVNSEYEWHIWGDGTKQKKEDYNEKIIEKKLEKKVFLKGYDKNIYEKYKEYSIYVMTSRHEGFPMVLLEAEASGLPVISFDCKLGPSEIIENNINGFIIENFDIDKMAKKIDFLFQNQEKIQAFSVESIKKSQEFKFDVIFKKWEKILG